MSALGIGVGTGFGGGATPLGPAPPMNAALYNWRLGGTRNKKILFWGDSTTAGPSPPWADIANKFGTAYGGAGQQADGVVLQNGGEIGATLTNAMNNTSTFNINWLLTQTFDLVVICFGINDVRQGAVNAAGISSLLTSAVNQIHTSKPNANIILWTPNSFLSNDPTSSGYVTPLASAQAYTDALWNGYNNVVGNWPTFVAHLDKQQIYGRTCAPGPTSLMQDIIHPDTNTGYAASLLPLANLVAPRGWPFSTLTTTDAFLTENILTLNGNALTDARGRHTLTAAAGTVTASGGWLVFDGASGLKILDNLTDFNYGISDGGSNDTARVTVEVQIISPVRAMTGQYYHANGNLQVSNGSDPNYDFQVFGALTVLSGGTPAVTGTKTDLAFCYSHDRASTYLNGVQKSLAYINADFTAGGAVALFIGQATDAWAAVFYQGQMRMRITRENRYNHNATYTPYPGPWPTS